MSEQTILQNIQDTEVPLQEEDTWLSIAKYLLFELGRLWDSWLDFRLKLLVILLAWLTVNILALARSSMTSKYCLRTS